MAVPKNRVAKKGRQSAAITPQHAATAPLSSLPFGSVPPGVAMTPMPMFPPELQAELKKARDSSGGKWLILVYRAVPEESSGNSGGHAVHLHICRGPNWNEDWLLRAYRLFVAKMLEFSGRITEFLAEPKKPESAAAGNPQE